MAEDKAVWTAEEIVETFHKQYGDGNYPLVKADLFANKQFIEAEKVREFYKDIDKIIADYISETHDTKVCAIATKIIGKALSRFGKEGLGLEEVRE